MEGTASAKTPYESTSLFTMKIRSGNKLASFVLVSASVGVVIGGCVLVVALLTGRIITDLEVDREEGDLSWQLGVLAERWGVEVPSGVSLKSYRSSEVGPHGEIDAVYVVQAGDVRGTWLDGAFEPPSRDRSEQLVETASAASAQDVIGKVKDLRCIHPLKMRTSDTLTVCRTSDADSELVLLEHVPIT